MLSIISDLYLCDLILVLRENILPTVFVTELVTCEQCNLFVIYFKLYFYFPVSVLGLYTSIAMGWLNPWRLSRKGWWSTSLWSRMTLTLRDGSPSQSPRGHCMKR